MSKTKIKKFPKKQLIATGIVTGLTFVMYLLLLSQTISEWWSRNITRSYTYAASFLTGWIPFSITELFFYALFITVIALIVLFIRALVKRRYRKIFYRLITIALVASCFLNAFVLNGLAPYNRDPLAIPQYDLKVDHIMALDALDYFGQDFNYVANILPRDERGLVKVPTVKQMSDDIAKEFARLDNKYFMAKPPRIKKATTPLWAWFSISGMFFTPFGEGIICTTSTPAYNQPMVIAHEMAHGAGIMIEFEANALAFYLMLTSENLLFRYSAYMTYYREATSAARLTLGGGLEAYNTVNEISPYATNQTIINEFDVAYQDWVDFSNSGLVGFTKSVGRWWNDLYLRMMGSPDGDGSYWQAPEYEYEKDEDGNDKQDDDGYFIVDTTTISLNIFQKILFDVFVKGN